MGTLLELLGMLLLAGGIVIRYRLNRKRYYRRYQRQPWVSYEKKLWSNIGEELQTFLSILLIVVGLLTASFGWWARQAIRERNQRMQQRTNVTAHHHPLKK